MPAASGLPRAITPPRARRRGGPSRPRRRLSASSGGAAMRLESHWKSPSAISANIAATKSAAGIDRLGHVGAAGLEDHHQRLQRGGDDDDGDELGQRPPRLHRRAQLLRRRISSSAMNFEVSTMAKPMMTRPALSSTPEHLAVPEAPERPPRAPCRGGSARAASESRWRARSRGARSVRRAPAWPRAPSAQASAIADARRVPSNPCSGAADSERVGPCNPEEIGPSVKLAFLLIAAALARGLRAARARPLRPGRPLLRRRRRRRRHHRRGLPLARDLDRQRLARAARPRRGRCGWRGRAPRPRRRGRRRRPRHRPGRGRRARPKRGAVGALDHVEHHRPLPAPPPRPRARAGACAPRAVTLSGNSAQPAVAAQVHVLHLDLGVRPPGAGQQEVDPAARRRSAPPAGRVA